MDKEKKCDLHPTMKPIEVVARAIKNSSKKDEKVLDLFGGSGSTLIACEQLERSCYMMELDPKYVDVIINRWEQFTGKQAVLLSENITE
jgi:DNA modification methylase